MARRVVIDSRLRLSGVTAGIIYYAVGLGSQINVAVLYHYLIKRAGAQYWCVIFCVMVVGYGTNQRAIALKNKI